MFVKRSDVLTAKGMTNFEDTGVFAPIQTAVIHGRGEARSGTFCASHQVVLCLVFEKLSWLSFIIRIVSTEHLQESHCFIVKTHGFLQILPSQPIHGSGTWTTRTSSTVSEWADLFPWKHQATLCTQCSGTVPTTRGSFQLRNTPDTFTHRNTPDQCRGQGISGSSGMQSLQKMLGALR